MSTTNINQVGYDRRLRLIATILASFNLEATDLTTIEYVDHCPFPFNNFIYKVALKSPATPSSFPKQPGTTPPSASGIDTLVIRLSNSAAEGLNNTNRVQNEVAAAYLVRAALPEAQRDVVPAVYAWAPYQADVAGEDGFGWTVMAFRPGKNLDAQFPEMEDQERTDVIQQVADLVGALQAVRLPEGVRCFGGLTFDEEGEIVSGEFPLLKGGPWERYEDVWIARLNMQLEEADGSEAIRGWKDGGVRTRIDRFLEVGVKKMLHNVEMVQSLVHGDLSEPHLLHNNDFMLTGQAMNNMLYDSDSKFTALLDFDWASVIHPCHEFFSGLHDLGGGSHPEDASLKSAVLLGKMDASPDGLSKEEAQKWETARTWDAALAARNLTRPSTIRGIEELERLREFEDLLCPFTLGSSVMVKRIGPGGVERKRREIQGKIIDFLASAGF